MSIRRLLAYGAIYFLWGGSFLGIRELVAVVPPFFAAGFRFTLAGLLLVGYSHLRGRAEMPRGSLVGASTLGFIMFTLMYAALFWGEILVPSGIAAVISAMIPVWIFIGELAILRTQRATLLSVAGIVLGFAGVVVLAWQAPVSGIRTSTLAVLVLIGGTLCWSGGTLLSRRLTLPRPQTLNAGWQMAIGGALLLLLSAAAGEMRRLPPLSVLLRPTLVFSMAYLIFAASIVSFTCYVWLIAHEPVTRVSSYAYVNPVIALLAGAVLAGERLSAFQLIGVLLVLAGVFATLTGKQVAPVKKSVTV
ncbi:EamA family transporter [Alloacidobacterium dinghuense]|uniref:EamA family transporter n=1 Tax=Alloacidobacterium dinghuense TaxID=2763107 RepID=A0A7G8BHL6_9BACT|nr:EamA family transporter [Alloacidobacterium dinghuense]QNI32036.1 EamA family transporter [Alloacidobacterium dinghuense]